MEINIISLGLLIGNVHIFLLPLRDVEPISNHCSILTALFLCGFGIYFLGLWSLLEKQLIVITKAAHKIYRRCFLPMVPKKTSQQAPSQTSRRRNNQNRFRLSLFLSTVTIVMALSIIFVILSPFQSNSFYLKNYFKNAPYSKFEPSHD